MDRIWLDAFKGDGLSALPIVTGTITAVSLERPTEEFIIECELPGFGFTRASLANWNLYLPGVHTYGIANSEDPTIGYWIARDPADYIVGVSHQPSEIFGDQYAWYERGFRDLARDGLWLTVSSAELQQESAYRLYAAGGLIGLGGGLLVAAIQSAVEGRGVVAEQRPIQVHQASGPPRAGWIDFLAVAVVLVALLRRRDRLRP